MIYVGLFYHHHTTDDDIHGISPLTEEEKPTVHWKFSWEKHAMLTGD